MALTKKERQIVEYGKQRGKSKTEVLMALEEFRSRDKKPEKKRSFLKQVKDDAKATVEGIRNDLDRRKENIGEAQEAFEEGEQSQARTTFQRAGQAAGGLGDIIGGLAIGFGKTVLPKKAEEAIKNAYMGAGELTTEAIAKVGGVEAEDLKTEIGDTALNIIDRVVQISEENPKLGRDIGAILGIGEVVVDLVGARSTRPLREAVGEATETAVRRTKNLFGPDESFKTVDDVIETADNRLAQQFDDAKPIDELSPAERRARAEAEEVPRNLKEKWLGMTAAQKKEIRKAGPEKTKEYIDAVTARNLDVNAPSVMEHGGDNVRKTLDTLNSKLDDTGSDIGRIRQKLENVRAPIDELDEIESTFRKELDELNLELRNGEVVQQSGKVTKVGSQRDINVLNRLYDDIKITKQSQKLSDIIDLRNAFDAKIKFGKRAGEVSNEVDPVSRSVRSRIKETIDNVVGKEGAEDVSRYSDVIKARNTLREWTDRKAGGEYLIRSVLSGRGGEARQIIQTVKDITGNDLMEDATLMTVATDWLANNAQKTLFAQEVQGVGQDVFRALRGDVGAIGSVAVKLLKERGIDPEKVLKEAAE